MNYRNMLWIGIYGPVSVRCLHVSKCKHASNPSRINRRAFSHTLAASENLNFVFRPQILYCLELFFHLKSCTGWVKNRAQWLSSSRNQTETKRAFRLA